MPDPTKMNSIKVTNTFEGVLLLGQDESMLLSVGNAEKLRNDLNEALGVAAGYQLSRLPAEEVVDFKNSTAKILLDQESYLIDNVLTERNDMIVIQWHDDYGIESELRVPSDFLVTVLWVIE
jgi:hypothetical protein